MNYSRRIDIDQISPRMSSGGQLVDVREAAEYARARVPGAVNIPMGHLPDRLSSLDRSRPVMLICQAGNRSAATLDLLLAQGFDAHDVAGGTDAWVTSGRPLEAS